MKKNKLAQVTFKKLSERQDIAIIENFIVGDSTQVPKSVFKEYPMVFDGLILGICLKGNAKVKINFREYELTPNTIFTILPSEIFESEGATDDFFAEVLAFSIDFFIGLPLPEDFDILENISNSPILRVSEKGMEDVIEFHSFIVKAFNREKHAYTHKVVRALLLALLIELGTMYKEKKIEKNKATSRSEEIVNRFFIVLRDHYKKERSASFYADKLCVTSKHLSSVLKKVTGRSINVWIDEAVIIGAKMLLKTSDLTVLQVSEEMNFPNPSFFGKFFKQHVGMTPVAYREM